MKNLFTLDPRGGKEKIKRATYSPKEFRHGGRPVSEAQPHAGQRRRRPAARATGDGRGRIVLAALAIGAIVGFLVRRLHVL